MQNNDIPGIEGLIEHGMQAFAKAQARVLAPLRNRLEAIRDMESAEERKAALTQLKTDLPGMLESMNLAPETATVLEGALNAAVVNGFEMGNHNDQEDANMEVVTMNREFRMQESGWYHVVPLGEYPHSSGVVQVVDAESVLRICNRFAEEAQNPNFPGVLVDFDHFSEFPDKPSEAAGWVKALENRADGIWGNIRWSDSGEAAVKGGRYRLVSPVLMGVKMGTKSTEHGAKMQNRVRPVQLVKVALTNDPNMKGMVPLSNRKNAEHRTSNIEHRSVSRTGNQETNLTNRCGGGAAAAKEQTTKERRPMTEKIAKKLNLAAEASEDSIVEAVVQLQNRATSAEARVTALETSNKELLTAQVESDLAKYANRIKPEAKDKFKAMLIANRAGTIELLESLDEAPMRKLEETAAKILPMTNRATAKTPGGGAALEPNKDKERMDAIEDFRIANRCTYEVAFNSVMRKRPELFTNDQ